MPDFSALLRKPAGEAKRPPVLPPGDYPGVIKSFEIDDKNKNRTPYVRFHLGISQWADGVPDSWEVFDSGSGKSYTVSKPDVDLSKRQMRRDYFFTDDALWRLDELLRSIGVEPKGRVYEECLPEAINAQVLIEVQQYINPQNNEIGNQVGKLVGQS